MHSQLQQLDRREPSGPGRLRPVAPGIWATPDEPLGGPANTCGFLLQRAAGNVFVYSCAAIADFFDHIAELGGVTTVVLNHRDEATEWVSDLAERFDAVVHTHVAEVEPCTRRGVRSIEPLTDPETALGDDLLAIHTPGHTPGVVSYLWSNQADRQRYLFTGDTLTNFTIDRMPAVLGFHPYDGNLDDLKRSLTDLRERDSDVLLPGLANGTINAYSWTTPARHEFFDDALAQLSDG